VVGVIDDLLRSVTELTHRLRRAQAVMNAAAAHARGVHDGTDGTDGTGSITIVIDDDGTARDVLVAPDWRRRLSPADVGPAVVAADTEAARRRVAATVEALVEANPSVGEAGAPEHSPVDGQESPAGPSPGAATAGLAGPTPPAGPGGPPRPLADLTAAVLAAVDDFDQVTEPPRPVVGIGGAGAVHVMVAHGRITECTVNQAWLAHQDEVTLAHALREAISAAAAATLAARRPFIDYQQRLETLVAEARATLHDLSRGPRS
jgi:hypothetical protein